MPLGGDLEPGRPQKELNALGVLQAQLGGLAAGVESGQDGLPLRRPGEGQQGTLGRPVADVSPAQGGGLLPQVAQAGEPAKQFIVLPAPGKGAAVKGSSKPSIPASSP